MVVNTRRRPRVVLTPAGVAGADELDDLLAAVAGAVAAPPPVRLSSREMLEALLEAAMTLAGALDLLEHLYPGGVFDEAKHPRWPKGTPGGLGGQFMRIGQRFKFEGVEYDVADVVPEGIVAHVATKGQTVNAGTVFFSAKKLAGEKTPENPEGLVVPGVERPPAEPLYSHKHGGVVMLGDSNITVVDPFVHAETHDAAVEIPDGSPLTEEQWSHFGRVDQLRYSELMERYGTWTSGSAKSKLTALKAQLGDDLMDKVLSAGSSQGGSSSSQSLSFLNQTWNNIWDAIKAHTASQAKIDAMREEYERLKWAQAEVAGIMQWDLYNRLKAPSVASFHKSDHGLSWWQEKILSGGNPVFSGLSQSYWYRQGFWGDPCIAAPIAIRHVVMAEVTGGSWNGIKAAASGGIGIGGYGGEFELSIADQMRYDADHCILFSSSSGPPVGFSGNWGTISAWLQGITNKVSGGDLIDELREQLFHGAPTPEIPVDADIQLEGGETHGWSTPPVEIVKQALAVALKHEYVDKAEGGGGVAHPAIELAQDGGLVPGDIVQGNPGSPTEGCLYLMIADPTEAAFGMKKYQLTDTDGVTPMQEEKVFGSASNWQTQLKKLVGHIDIPAPVVEEPGAFHPEAWVLSGELKKVGQMAPGEKFKHDGIVYEVVGPAAGQKTLIKVASTLGTVKAGTPGTVNSAYKAEPLKLIPGMTEAGVPAFDPTGYFTGLKAHKLGDEPLEAGDVIKIGQTHYEVVATYKKGADIDLKALTGSKAGKVVVVHKGGGSYVHMTQKPPGWEPPAVGDTLAYGGKKGTVTMLLKDGTVRINLHPGKVDLAPEDPALAGLFSPEKFELGAKMKLGQMAPGMKFHGGSGGKVRPYLVLEQHAKKTLVRNLDTGAESEISKQKSFVTLQHKAKGMPKADQLTPDTSFAPDAFDLSAFQPSGKQKGLGELEQGELFLNTAGKAFVVEDAGPSSVKLKSLSDGSTTTVATNASPIKYEMLQPVGAGVAQTVFDPNAYVEGDQVTLADLSVGDMWKGKSGQHFMVLKTGAKTGLTAVNLETGKVSSPWKYGLHGTQMHSKATHPIAYEDLRPGDPAKLGDLHEGDEFTLGGAAYKVVKQLYDPAEDTGSTKVAPILAGGGTGMEMAGGYPLLQVTLKAKNGTALAQPQLPGEPVDVDSLPEAALAPFSPKSKSGGGYTFTKLKFATAGMIVQDKSGKVWVVKDGGPTAVLSDGSANYKADGDVNLKVSAEALLVDEAPPLENGKALPPLMPAGGKSLGELGVAQGDYLTTSQYPDAVWKVLSVDEEAGQVQVMNLAPGNGVKTFSFGFEPDLFGSPAIVDVTLAPEPAAEPGAPPLPPGYMTDGEPVHPSQLKVGDLFTDPSTGVAAVWKVVSQNEKEPLAWDVEQVQGPAPGMQAYQSKGTTAKLAQKVQLVGVPATPAAPSSVSDFEPTGEKLSSDDAPVGTYLMGVNGDVLQVTGHGEQGAEFVIVTGPDAGTVIQGSGGVGGKKGPPLPVLAVVGGTLPIASVSPFDAALKPEDVEVVGEKPTADLEVGDLYLGKTLGWEKLGLVYKVVAKDSKGWITVQQVGPTIEPPKQAFKPAQDGDAVIFALKAHGAEGFAPTTATVGELPAGAQFAIEDPADPSFFGSVWEVTGHENGLTKFKVASSAGNPVYVGTTGEMEDSWKPSSGSLYVKQPGAPLVAAPEPTNLPSEGLVKANLADLAPGTKFKITLVGGGSTYYVNEEGKMTSLIGGDHWASQFIDTGGVVTVYVQPQDAGAAASPWAEIPPLTGNYPDGQTLEALGLAGGDYFVDNGKPLKIVDADWQAHVLLAVNLETGEVAHYPKDFAPTSWAKAPAPEAEPLVKPSALKVGDVVKQGDEANAQVYQVVAVVPLSGGGGATLSFVGVSPDKVAGKHYDGQLWTDAQVSTWHLVGHEHGGRSVNMDWSEMTDAQKAMFHEGAVFTLVGPDSPMPGPWKIDSINSDGYIDATNLATGDKGSFSNLTPDLVATFVPPPAPSPHPVEGDWVSYEGGTYYVAATDSAGVTLSSGPGEMAMVAASWSGWEKKGGTIIGPPLAPPEHAYGLQANPMPLSALAVGTLVAAGAGKDSAVWKIVHKTKKTATLEIVKAADVDGPKLPVGHQEKWSGDKKLAQVFAFAGEQNPAKELGLSYSELKLGDAEVGDLVSMGDKAGVWKVLGKDSATGLVDLEMVAPAASATKPFPVGYHYSTSPAESFTWSLKAAAPASLAAFDPDEWEKTGDGGMVQNMLGALQPGVVFKSESGSWYSVVGPTEAPDSGLQSITVEQLLTPSGIAPETGGYTFTISPEVLVDVYAKKGGALSADEPVPPGFTLNAEDKTFLELGLKPGDKVDNWEGQPETVTQVYGEPGTDGHVYDTVNDVTGEKSTYGTGGHPHAYSLSEPLNPKLDLAIDEKVTWGGESWFVDGFHTDAQGNETVYLSKSMKGTAGHKIDKEAPLGEVKAWEVDVQPGDQITNLAGGPYTVAAVKPGIDGGAWLTFEGQPPPTHGGEGHFHLNPGEEAQVGLVKASALAEPPKVEKAKLPDMPVGTTFEFQDGVYTVAGHDPQHKNGKAYTHVVGPDGHDEWYPDDGKVAGHVRDVVHWGPPESPFNAPADADWVETGHGFLKDAPVGSHVKTAAGNVYKVTGKIPTAVYLSPPDGPETPQLAAEPGVALTFVEKAVPEASKVALGSLAPGDVFHAANVHGTPAGDYVVLPPGHEALFSEAAGEKEKLPDDVDENAAVWAQNTATGKVYWFGDALYVAKVGEQPAPPDGETAWGYQLKAGDYITLGGAGTPYKVAEDVDGKKVAVKVGDPGDNFEVKPDVSYFNAEPPPVAQSTISGVNVPGDKLEVGKTYRNPIDGAYFTVLSHEDADAWWVEDYGGGGSEGFIDKNPEDLYTEVNPATDFKLASLLPVGGEFEDMKGEKWTVVGKSDDWVYAVPIGLEGEGEEPDMVEPGSWTYPLSTPNTVAELSGNLKAGDQFVYGGHLGEVTAAYPTGIEVKWLDGIPGEGLTTQSMGLVAEVQKVVYGGGPPKPVLPENVGSVSVHDMHPGDQFESSTGYVFKVVGKGKTGVQAEAVWAPPNASVFDTAVGDVVPFTGATTPATFLPATEEDYGAMFEPPPAGSVENPAVGGLKAYSPKSKSGHGLVFADLGDLEPGDTFSDKTGATFTVGAKTPDGYYVNFTDQQGDYFQAAAPTRVKVASPKAAPPPPPSGPDEEAAPPGQYLEGWHSSTGWKGEPHVAASTLKPGDTALIPGLSVVVLDAAQTGYVTVQTVDPPELAGQKWLLPNDALVEKVGA